MPSRGHRKAGAKRAVITVRCTWEERDRLRAASRLADKNLNAWAMRVLLDGAERTHLAFAHRSGSAVEAVSEGFRRGIAEWRFPRRGGRHA